MTTTPSTVQAVVDVSAIRDNAAEIARRIAPAELIAVVKADAYGHSVRAVVPACLEAGVRTFGVATAAEAAELIELLGACGATVGDPDAAADPADVRVLFWLHDAATDLTPAVAAGVEIGISTEEGLDRAAAAAAAAGRTARIHVKADTGLGRSGFTPDQLAPVCERIAGGGLGDGVEVVGLMTHFASADDPSDPATADQIAALARCEEMLAAALESAGRPPLRMRHLANSPGALSLTPVPGTHARVGLSLYGLSPFDDASGADLGLRPAMRLTSRVLTVKDVPAGHGASYGLTYRAPQDTRFALIAGGYADGIPRAASGRGAEVSIRGRRLPVVGRIAMDQMIVDLGDADAEIGDEVVIIGDGETGPSAEEWGAWSHSINYEVVTRIGPRVDRVAVDAKPHRGRHADDAAAADDRSRRAAEATA